MLSFYYLHNVHIPALRHHDIYIYTKQTNQKNMKGFTFKYCIFHCTYISRYILILNNFHWFCTEISMQQILTCWMYSCVYKFKKKLKLLIWIEYWFVLFDTIICKRRGKHILNISMEFLVVFEYRSCLILLIEAVHKSLPPF